jgi:hypothetical protein
MQPPPFSCSIKRVVRSLSVLWEKRSRRAELALFTLPRAIDTAWKMSVEKGFVSDVKNGPVRWPSPRSPPRLRA